ncbi:hypothetical protein PRIPAC_75084, partial [Pristionchus pacificus]
FRERNGRTHRLFPYRTLVTQMNKRWLIAIYISYSVLFLLSLLAFSFIGQKVFKYPSDCVRNVLPSPSSQISDGP